MDADRDEGPSGAGKTDFRNLHDAQVWKIENRGSDRSTIYFSTVEGRKYALNAHGVRRLKCDNFCEGNIVLDVELVDSEEAAINVLEQMLDLPQDFDRSFIVRFAREVRNGQLTLFLVNPSYGCEITCLCKEIEFNEVAID